MTPVKFFGVIITFVSYKRDIFVILGRPSLSRLEAIAIRLCHTNVSLGFVIFLSRLGKHSRIQNSVHLSARVHLSKKLLNAW